jgi:hypothetical protein
MDLSVLSPFLSIIMNLLLRRMQESTKVSKNVRYCKLFIHFSSLFCFVHGATAWYQVMEASTPGLVGMLVLNIFVPNRAAIAASDPYEAKHYILGMSRLLLETPVAQNPEQFSSLLKTIMSLMEVDVAIRTVVTGIENDGEDDGKDEEAVDTKEFDSVYSKLAFATVSPLDAASVVAAKQGGVVISDAPAHFIKSLGAFCQARPGQYVAAIQAALDAKDMNVLQCLCAVNQIALQ